MQVEGWRERGKVSRWGSPFSSLLWDQLGIRSLSAAVEL